MAANDQYEPCKLELDACGSCLAGCSHDRAHACTQQEIRTYEENIELPPSDPPSPSCSSPAAAAPAPSPSAGADTGRSGSTVELKNPLTFSILKLDVRL